MFENQNIKLKHENVFLSRQKKGLKEKIAMGGIVEVEFDCDSWIDISKENAKFISYDYPNKK